MATFPTSPMRGDAAAPLHADDTECSDGNATSPNPTVLREYMSTLPATFEDDACPPLLDESEGRERELARLDREGLTRCARNAVRRHDEALMELLEQEQALSEALTKLRYLESQLGDREDDLEELRSQLRASDDFVEGLLREKADALRMLTEAKKELASVSARAASLQRDLDAKTKSEKGHAGSPVSTPGTTAAGTSTNSPLLRTRTVPKEEEEGGTAGSANVAGHRRGLRNEASGFLLPNHEKLLGVAAASTNSVVKGENTSPVIFGNRRHSMGSGDPQSLGFVSEREKSQGGGADAFKGEAAKDGWRRLYIESRKRNESLERELAKAQAVCNGCSIAFTDDISMKGTSHDSSYTLELYARLRRNMAEMERMERELSQERERIRKQNRLEVQLLKDVARLARKLRAHENVENKLRAQRRKDMSLSKEELLDELFRCRLIVSNLTAEMSAPDGHDSDYLLQKKDHQEQRPTKGEAVMTEELACALCDALTANEGLRAEVEAVCLEKKAREASYEVELQSRLAKMEELTTALQELREQVNVLRRKRHSHPGAS